MGNGHSSNNNVITAGPKGSSNGITLIKDWTTSNHPSSKSKSRRLYDEPFLKMWKYITYNTKWLYIKTETLLAFTL